MKPYTYILGAVLTLVGIAGFFLVQNDLLLGIFKVNALHNVVHILSGVIALWSASSGYAYARMYLILFGVIYAAVAVVGLTMGGDIFGLMHVNAEDNYLHIAIAVTCLAVGLGSKK